MKPSHRGPRKGNTRIEPLQERWYADCWGGFPRFLLTHQSFENMIPAPWPVELLTTKCNVLRYFWITSLEHSQQQRADHFYERVS